MPITRPRGTRENMETFKTWLVRERFLPMPSMSQLLPQRCMWQAGKINSFQKRSHLCWSVQCQARPCSPPCATWAFSGAPTPFHPPRLIRPPQQGQGGSRELSGEMKGAGGGAGGSWHCGGTQVCGLCHHVWNKLLVQRIQNEWNGMG